MPFLRTVVDGKMCHLSSFELLIVQLLSLLIVTLGDVANATEEEVDDDADNLSDLSGLSTDEVVLRESGIAPLAKDFRCHLSSLVSVHCTGVVIHVNHRKDQ